MSPQSKKPVPSVPAASAAQGTLSRRTVFAGAGLATAAAAAAVVLPRTGAVAPAADAGAAAAPRDDAHGRYQDTAHVQHYYRTTRV